MENGIHLHSMCRQIQGTSSNISEFIQGTKGSWSSNGHIIKDLKGNEVWKYDYETQNAEFKQSDPYILEHVNWINHIRSGKLIERASETAIANMYAIMGLESAYTGKRVTWQEMTASTLDLYPKDLDLVKKMDVHGYGSDKEYKLPDYIHVAGEPSPGSKQTR
jgi:hypothetical protein